MSHWRSQFHNRINHVGGNQFAPDILFWAAFLALNLFLFLPLSVLNGENGALVRLNLELTLLTALGVFIHRVRGALYRRMFVAIYILALVYYVYEGVTLAVYNAEPVLYNQLYMYGEGLPFLLQHLQLSPLIYVALGSTVAIGVGLIILLVHILLNDARLPRLSHGSRILLGALTLLLLFMTVSYRAALANPDMLVSSLGYKLQRNASKSLALRASAASFDDQPVQTAYATDSPRLLRRPNVYLIFVESYGSVLYKRDDYRILYTDLLTELMTELEADQWHAVSSLSTAPTWGGGSWLSYTSALFGLRIDNQPQFLALFDRYQQRKYPHVGHFLQMEGYDFNWLTSITTELSEAKWLQYQRFYGTDQWYRHRDLKYIGQEYSWGPAPPDQYSLNYTRALIRERTADPFVLFFITQTSHYPWTDLPTITDDWRTLNQETAGVVAETIDPDEMAHSTRRSNYMRAIDYELHFLVDTILSEDEDAIFVLIGDHQPPRVSKRADGFETPVHIISRDPAFLAEFEAHGFTPGLIAPDLEPDMRHEGFYSLFKRALLARYGDQSAPLPAYLPNGIDVETPEDMQP